MMVRGFPDQLAVFDGGNDHLGGKIETLGDEIALGGDENFHFLSSPGPVIVSDQPVLMDLAPQGRSAPAKQSRGLLPIALAGGEGLEDHLLFDRRPVLAPARRPVAGVPALCPAAIRTAGTASPAESSPVT